MSKISYSGVVLNEDSRNKLISYFEDVIPEGWEIIAHHMTIYLGELKPDHERFNKKTVELKVEKLGKSDMAIAVMVSGFYSKNDIPHITLAVNRKEGGKPVMSNNIKDWIDINFPYKLIGKVEEVPYK